MKKELAFIESQMESTGGIGDGTPRGTDVSDKTGRIAALLADQKAQYEYIVTESLKIRSDIENTINQVEDPLHAQLLYNRYIKCMSWRKVAEAIHISEDHTRGRLHKAALLAVEEIIAN